MPASIRGAAFTASRTLLLCATLFASAAHMALAQDDGVLWSRMLSLTDGRVFVTDGALTLDASVAKPASLPTVELSPATAPIVEGYLTAELPDEFASSELAAGERDGTYQAPSGVTLRADYVRYLRRLLSSTDLRFRMRGDNEPVVILADGSAIGLLMPVKR